MVHYSQVHFPPLLTESVQKPQRYCFCGGGTGGHVYPALAVAEALCANNEREQVTHEHPYRNHNVSGHTQSSKNVVYIGSAGGMEQHIIASESTLPYRALPTAPFRGKSVVTMVRNSATLLAGTGAAIALLKEIRPAAILGTGGYVCVPVFLASRILKIPSLLFLPDVVPGLAVKWLSRIATQIACSVEDSDMYLGLRVKPLYSKQKNHHAGSLKRNDARFDQRLVVTGYPVRSQLFRYDRETCRNIFHLCPEQPVVIVYGGSRGARNINRAIEALLPDILHIAQVIHICGREGDDVWLREAARRLNETQQSRYRLYPYLESDGQQGGMTAALVAADLAICRSGASVLGELPALGLPALLVPYPYVHQDENADYLVRHGAAIKIADDAMLGNGHPTDGPLFGSLQRLLKTHTHERQDMAARSRALARRDAAQHVADALRRLAAKGGV